MPRRRENKAIFESLGIEMTTNIKIDNNNVLLGSNGFGEVINITVTLARVSLKDDYFIKVEFLENNTLNRPNGEFIKMIHNGGKIVDVTSSLQHVNIRNIGLSMMAKTMTSGGEVITVSFMYWSTPGHQIVNVVRSDFSGERLTKKRKLEK